MNTFNAGEKYLTKEQVEKLSAIQKAIIDYAEVRHANGASCYNAKTKEVEHALFVMLHDLIPDARTAPRNFIEPRAEAVAHLVYDDIEKDQLAHVQHVLEESIEFAQAADYPKAAIAQLIDDVYAQPPGVFKHELGSLALVTYVTARSYGENIFDLLNEELGRVDRAARIDSIRARHLKKPRYWTQSP